MHRIKLAMSALYSYPQNQNANHGTLGGEFETFQYALPGEAGNSFGPSLVRAPDGLMYFYHNDESQHDGVHQWVLRGADALHLQS
jgi:hypothetical protein